MEQEALQCNFILFQLHEEWTLSIEPFQEKSDSIARKKLRAFMCITSALMVDDICAEDISQNFLCKHSKERWALL